MVRTILRLRNWHLVNYLSILLSLIGLFVAGLLVARDWLSVDLSCYAESSCNIVSNSPVSRVLGLPISVYGLLLCLVLLILGLMRFGSTDIIRNTRIAYGLLALGVFISLLLTGYSAFYLHALCSWCITFLIVLLINLSIHSRLYSLETPPVPRGSILGALALILAVTGVITLTWPLWIHDTSYVRFNSQLANSLSKDELFPIWSPVCGEPSAKRRLLMFGDFSCIACAESFPTLFNAIKGRNDINLTYRHFPNPEHSGSLTAAIVLQLAAREGCFWKMGVEVFESGDFRRPRLDEIALRFGLSKHSLEVALMKMPKSQSQTMVDADRSMALRLGLRATPSIILFEPNHVPRLISSREAVEVISRT